MAFGNFDNRVGPVPVGLFFIFSSIEMSELVSRTQAFSCYCYIASRDVINKLREETTCVPSLLYTTGICCSERPKIRRFRYLESV